MRSSTHTTNRHHGNRHRTPTTARQRWNRRIDAKPAVAVAVKSNVSINVSNHVDLPAMFADSMVEFPEVIRTLSYDDPVDAHRMRSVMGDRDTRLSTMSGDEFAPELELMRAVIEDAVAIITNGYGSTVAKYSKKKTTEEREALAWVFEGKWQMFDGKEWMFSFRSCCEALGLSVDYVRSGIKLMLEEGRAL